MRPRVHGPTVDEHTRCVHYCSELDVIAIRFACCGVYYPCHRCHDENASHDSYPWPAGTREEYAVLCGICWTELTIATYLATEYCPHCRAGFNPRCALHYPIYFE